MRLEIRYYKRFDPDLLALAEIGINLSEILKKALYAYARGDRYQVLVPVSKPHDLSGRQGLHSAVTITDDQSIRLLKQIKHMFRNSFCKILIRDALVLQSLSVFMTDKDCLNKEIHRIHEIEAGGTENMDVMYPSKKKESAQVRILGRESVKKDGEEKPKAKPAKNVSSAPAKQKLAESDSAGLSSPKQEKEASDSRADQSDNDGLFGVFRSMMDE